MHVAMQNQINCDMDVHIQYSGMFIAIVLTVQHTLYSIYVVELVAAISFNLHCICNSYQTLNGVREMHGRMHPN